MPGSENSAG